MISTAAYIVTILSSATIWISTLPPNVNYTIPRCEEVRWRETCWYQGVDGKYRVKPKLDEWRSK